MKVRALTVTLVGMLALAMSALVPISEAHADHVPPPGEGNGQQFVWPTSSWISSTDFYPNGNHHSGSADLSVDHFSVIYPARHGTVVRSEFGGSNYRVVLRHDGTDEDYYTRYVHMAERPLVEVGDVVDLDTPLGYVGRTGSAYWAGPHIHFNIRVGSISGPDIAIPDIAVGDWADVNDYIPGNYEGLDSIAPPNRTFDVEVSAEDMGAYETTSRWGSERLASLAVGEELTVLDSDNGQFRVELDGGQLGWVAHSGTTPVDSTVFPVRVSGSNAVDVRRTPGTTAQYFEDFTDDAVNKAPDDWTMRWRDSDWSVRNNPRRLQHEVSAQGRRALTWNVPDGDGWIDGDVEVHAEVRVPSATTSTRWQLPVHVSGSAGSENAYYLDAKASSVRINKYVDGTFTQLGTASLSHTVDSGTWYRVTLRRIGRWLRAKLWPAGTAEPSEWQLSVSDESLDGGRVGLSHFDVDATNDWRTFSVAVGGGHAPRSGENLDDNLIGAHAPSGADDRYLLGYEKSGDWRRVLWRCNEDQNRSDDPNDRYRALGGCPHREQGQSSLWKYGWVHETDAPDTQRFYSRTRIDGLNIYANKVVDGENQPNSSTQIGEFGDSRSLVLAHEVRNGWYRIQHNGDIAWTRGWYTGGPH